MLTCKEINSAKEYDATLDSADIPITQRAFFGEWQKKLGRDVSRYVIKSGDNVVARFQLIKYSISFGLEYWYIPHGPIVASNAPDDLFKNFAGLLRRLIKKSTPIFIRFDSYPTTLSQEDNIELKRNFKKVGAASYRSQYFQPKYEWVLDVVAPEEELLLNMHPKTRYNIGLAERRDITSKIVDVAMASTLDTLYEILSETAARDGFTLHPKKYYKGILEDSEKNNNAFLVVTSYGDKKLVIHYVAIFGKTAYFVFGGSKSEHRNRMPTHQAHWMGIKEAKKRGCTQYNFGGVSDGSKIYKNWESLTYFKERFGGRRIEYGDSYDLPVRKIFYKLYILRKQILGAWKSM
jgi:peptidoglycan pentaglycine glycine transferase (the first glycine)